MADPVSIAAMIAAVIAALGSFVVQAHLKKCSVAGCIKSDCTKEQSPPDTPIPSASPKTVKKITASSENISSV